MLHAWVQAFTLLQEGRYVYGQLGNNGKKFDGIPKFLF